MRLVRTVAKLSVLAGLIAALVLGTSIYREIFHGSSKRATEVSIPKGSSLAAVASLLHVHGVIRSPSIFRFYARFRGKAARLAAGDYEFPSGMSIADVLDKIVRGDVKRYRFTVIEGWNLREIEKMLRETEPFGAAIADAFAGAAFDQRFISSMGLEGILSLEGYLFPDTYVVLHAHDLGEIIGPMVRRFKGIYTSDFSLRAREIGMTDREVIILASIIEKETGRPEERELVSSVFHNRLKRGIPLATDPTVIYGIADFDGNLRRRDLERAGPYNTYLNAGLPPGPICNPGAASIRAALYPKRTSYLYFVSKNDGSHHFSETLTEHNRAVEHYQKRRADEPFKN